MMVSDGKRTAENFFIQVSFDKLCSYAMIRQEDEEAGEKEGRFHF